MSSKPASHRVFLTFALLSALVLASLPAQARPVRRPAAHLQPVTVSGDSVMSGLWRLILRMVTGKEGMSIDPNGGSNHGTVPPGDLTDEGVTIDPNGGR